MCLLEVALLVGAIGDISLQLIVNNSPGNRFGLRTYFQQHGSLESVFIASGMTAGFTALYNRFDPSLYTPGLIAYGATLDILFRQYHGHIMPSLRDYYKMLDPATSIVWGIIPLLIIKYIHQGI